jgi:hypothetical protein
MFGGDCICQEENASNGIFIDRNYQDLSGFCESKFSSLLKASCSFVGFVHNMHAYSGSTPSQLSASI